MPLPMKAVPRRIVLSAGCAVLAAIVLMLLSAAYLRGGHPPASGIAILVILAVATPAAVLATVLGLGHRADPGRPGDKPLFVMTGVCLAFAVFAATLLVLKFALGKSV
jgi:hypothetical protein